MKPEAAMFLPLAVVGACSTGRVAQVQTLAGSGSEIEVGRTIEQALEADARVESADSLYAPFATIIADGRIRRTVPRYAGVGGRGELAITSTQLQIRGTAAWAAAEYRWVSERSSSAQLGRATFVLLPAPGRQGWWVVQAHSSTAR
jgi:hypothetical protein